MQVGNLDLHRFELQVWTTYLVHLDYIYSIWSTVHILCSTASSETLGANYKKNLKIILRCDNNLR